MFRIELSAAIWLSMNSARLRLRIREVLERGVERARFASVSPPSIFRNE